MMKIERFGIKDKDILNYIHSVYDGVEDYLLPPYLPPPNIKTNEGIILTQKILKEQHDNFYFFLYYILGQYFSRGHNAIYEWGDILQKNNFVCILQSRDHLKSVFFTWQYPLYKILFKQTRGILIEAYNTTEANRRVELIKGTLSENKWFAHEKNVQGTWGNKRLKTKSGIEVSQGSPGQALRGRHPDLIIADDIESEKGGITFEFLKYYIDSVLIPMLPPNKGQLVIVGTPLTDNDLYAALKRNPAFYYREYPAITNDKKLLWSGYWTLEQLQQRKMAIGELTFNREYLMKPISTEDSLFNYDYIVKAFDKKLTIDTKFDEPEFVVMGNDYQRGSNKKADYSVFTIISKIGKYYYVNHIETVHGATVEQQLDIIERLFIEYDVNLVVSEDNGFQSVFIEELEKRNIPQEQFTTTYKTKFNILHRLKYMFEKRQIKLPKADEYDEITELVHQLLGIIVTQTGKLQSLTQHDDMVMSLQIAMNQILDQTQVETLLPSKEMLPKEKQITQPKYGLQGYSNFLNSLYDDRWDD